MHHYLVTVGCWTLSSNNNNNTNTTTATTNNQYKCNTLNHSLISWNLWFMHSRKTLCNLMRCEKFNHSCNPDIEGLNKCRLGVFSSLCVCVRPWKATLPPLPSSLSFSQAAFFYPYLTVVVNNPHNCFQMSLHPTLDLRMGCSGVEPLL